MPDLSLEGLGDGHMGSPSGSNSHNTVGESMANNAVSEAVSETVSDMSTHQAVSGEELGGCSSGSHQGGDADEGLKG